MDPMEQEMNNLLESCLPKVEDIQKYEETFSENGFSDTYEESDTKFGVTGLLGSSYSLSRNIQLIGGVNYAYVFHEAEQDGSNINYASVFLGFSFRRIRGGGSRFV